MQSSGSKETASDRRVRDAADRLERSERRCDHDRGEGGRPDTRQGDGEEIRRTRSARSVARESPQTRRIVIRTRSSVSCGIHCGQTGRNAVLGHI